MVSVCEKQGRSMLIRLEADVEKKVCGYADRIKLIHIKLNVLGRRGWPDRLFLPPGGRPIFIEFKRPGENPEPLQEYRHEILRAAGYRVFVVDNYADGIAALESPRLSA